MAENAVKEGYRVPAAQFEVETEVKKSRFIATGTPVGSETEMRAFIQAQRQRFPSANHHCSAYVIGQPLQPRAAGSDDDGEPSGTAGKPMLNVLMGQGVGDCCVVVTRFFGGIKLGAGGLVRAYGGAVKELLAHWPLELREPMAGVALEFSYDQQGSIDALLNRFDVGVEGSDYGAAVALQLALPQRNLAGFCAALDERAHLGVVYRKLY
ncbi:YigZ family protein [Marinobacterium zhoushanense]|uniref:YigZ family protein n=1 Tax=Marinobacterium zhoushanense TaxID=1679163 RepID=A0ABQ1JZK5_9GAMM|nr:YigZ family protein [Marinobacterium zhoushanense]GGB80409.1 YigZ family protein [Marinobacterium zhoushanense]